MKNDFIFFICCVGTAILLGVAIAYFAFLSQNECQRKGGHWVVTGLVPIVQTMGNGIIFVNQIPVQECRVTP